MKKILIVEDDQFLVSAYQAKFSHLKTIKIDIAFDGKQALEKIKKDKPDSIILDLVLPVMDGFELLEIMNKEKIDIPVLVASNLGSEKDIKHAKNLGAKDYFIKSSSSIKDIVDKITEIMK